MAHRIAKMMPIHFVNDKYHIKKLNSCRTDLTDYYMCLLCELLLMLLGTYTLTYINFPNKEISINQACTQPVAGLHLIYNCCVKYT